MCVVCSSMNIEVSSPINVMATFGPVCSILMSVMPSCLSFFTNKSTSNWPHSYFVFLRTSSRVGARVRFALVAVPDVAAAAVAVADSSAFSSNA